MTGNSAETAEAGARARTRTVVALAALAAVMAGGLFGVAAYVDGERSREIREWQVRLDIVAESRAGAVRGWLDSAAATLRGVADLAETRTTLNGSRTTDAPQNVSLRTLLRVAARQGGFLPPEPIAAASPPSGLGLAVAGRDGTVVAATRSMLPVSARLQAAIERVSQGATESITVLDLPSGPGIGLVVPVYGLDETAAPPPVTGVVLGIKAADGGLYRTLKQPGDSTSTGETVLLRAIDGMAEYMSPLGDGAAPFTRRLSLQDPDLAAARVVARPGEPSTARDYGGTEVLVTGRPVSGTSWVVMRKLALAEVLGPAERRLSAVMWVLALIVLALGLAGVAVWYHGTSVRSARALRDMEISLERFTNLTKFLTVVTDGYPAMIGAVSEEAKYTFANRQVGEAAGLPKEDVLDKTLGAVIGPVKGREIAAINRLVQARFEPETRTLAFDEEDGRRHVYQGFFLPLRGDRDYPPAVLHIIQEITDAVEEREKRARTMRGLVGTLVSLVDRRDPYSAHQSARVAEVAVAIAEEMDAPEWVRRTVDLAGNLMNLGKVLVPQALLTKTGRLTEEETALVRDSMLAGADLLAGLEFDMPVAEAVRDLQERWDGSGYPLGKKGEEIEPAARIISVANAFVSMVSPRAYRDAMPFERAVHILREASDRAFDRRPVSALINHLDNRSGRETWAHFMQPPEETGGSAHSPTQPAALPPENS